MDNANKELKIRAHLEVYKERAKRDYGNSYETIVDFLQYLESCGLEIVIKDGTKH